MRKWGFLLLLGVLAALAVEFRERDRGEPILTGHPGYPVYDAVCRKCHGNRGNRAKASRMAKREVDLGSPAFRDTTDLSAILRIVSKGKGRMKGYAGKLDSSEIASVSAYLREMPGALAAGRDSLER